MSYVGLPHPNSTSTVLGDSLIQDAVTVAEPIVVEPMSLVTVLTADNPPNEPDNMDVPLPPSRIARLFDSTLLGPYWNPTHTTMVLSIY